jgi:hypothetical protein
VRIDGLALLRIKCGFLKPDLPAHRMLTLQMLGVLLGLKGGLQRARSTLGHLRRRNRWGLRGRGGHIREERSISSRFVFSARHQDQASRRIPRRYGDVSLVLGSFFPAMCASISAEVRGAAFVLRKPICRLVVLGNSIGLSVARGAIFEFSLARSLHRSMLA